MIRWVVLERKGGGGYGRDLDAEVHQGTCDVCLDAGPCLWSDGSGGEYSAFSICETCTVAAFRAFDAQEAE